MHTVVYAQHGSDNQTVPPWLLSVQERLPSDETTAWQRWVS